MAVRLRHVRWPFLVMLVAASFTVLASPQQPSAGPPPAQTPGQRPQGPSFRAGVELVSLNVTVTDGTSRFVTDLTQDDFAVYEDGIKQDLTYFTKSNLPIAL